VPSAIAPLNVLIADDQADVLVALELLLKGAGCRAVSVSSPPAVLAATRERRFDVVLIDLNYTRDTTSGKEGLDLLAELHRADAALPIVVMTAWGSIDLAVEAMRRGARDFVMKPWDNAALLRTLRTQARSQDRRSPLERVQEDLAIARQVQSNLFPREAGDAEGLRYSGACLQAGAVGGDYYDFLRRGGSEVAALLADVSGKGISAALLMANLQATVRTQMDRGLQSTGALLAAVNRYFLESTEPQHFATMFFASFRCGERRLNYLNCGHNPALLLRTNGDVVRLESTAPVLGILADWPYEEGEVTLAAGDLLVMYSDGVVEAGRDAERDYGEDRLIDLLQRIRQREVDHIPDLVIEDVKRWSSALQEDDLTVVALRAL
jgi:sigma-B regulation protein RsbU (phosphoserine phosphatase)